MSEEIGAAINLVAEKARLAGKYGERERCLRLLHKVMVERPASALEALVRLGELIDDGN